MGICVIFVTQSPMDKLVDDFTPLIIMNDDDMQKAGLKVSLYSKE